MGCSQGLARIFVFIANFIFALVGFALLVVGILFKVNFVKLTDAIPDEAQALQYIPLASIVVVSIIFVIAFLGCCGILQSNTCMLSWYGGISIVIFLVQVALGIYAFVQIKNRETLVQIIKRAVGSIFDKHLSSMETVNFIQKTFKCCGTFGTEYWTGQTIPPSCYVPESTELYHKGCGYVVTDYIIDSMKTIAIVVITFSAVEVVGAVLALCLTTCIRESRRQGAYY